MKLLVKGDRWKQPHLLIDQLAPCFGKSKREKRNQVAVFAGPKMRSRLRELTSGPIKGQEVREASRSTELGQVKMQTFAIYLGFGLSLLFAALILVVNRFCPRLLRPVHAWILRCIAYRQIPLIRMTVPELLACAVYLAPNIILITPNIIKIDPATTSINVALINLVPLFLGGKNPIANFLGTPRAIRVAHQWIAVVALAQAFVHGILHLQTGTMNPRKLTGVIAASCLLTSFLVAPWFLRLNLLTKPHKVLVPFVFGTSIGHLIVISKQVVSLPWLLVLLCALSWLVSRTFIRRRRAEIMEVVEIGGVLRVRVRIKSPIKAQPAHFDIHFSGLPLRHRFRSQSLPIAWWGPGNEIKDFEFLIQPSTLPLAASVLRERHVTLKGPYNEKLGLGEYETVILTAEGIGIAGVLPFMLSLVERIDRDRKKKARQTWIRSAEGLSGKSDSLNNDKTRKLDLYWKLDSDDHRPVSEYLETLRTRLGPKQRANHVHMQPLGDSNDPTGPNSAPARVARLLQIWVSYPGEPVCPLPAGWTDISGRYLEATSMAIGNESRRTPGKSIVVGTFRLAPVLFQAAMHSPLTRKPLQPACGSPKFKKAIRDAVRSHIDGNNLITFRELDHTILPVHVARAKERECPNCNVGGNCVS